MKAVALAFAQKQEELESRYDLVCGQFEEMQQVSAAQTAELAAVSAHSGDLQREVERLSESRAQAVAAARASQELAHSYAAFVSDLFEADPTGMVFEERMSAKTGGLSRQQYWALLETQSASLVVQLAQEQHREGRGVRAGERDGERQVPTICAERLQAHRTYVRVAALGGVDGDGVPPSTQRDAYRALLAVYGSEHRQVLGEGFHQTPIS